MHPLRVKSVSPSHVLFKHLSPAGLQSQVLWGLLLLRLAPQAGSLTWGLEPSQEWEIVFDVIVLQFVGHHLTDMGFDFIMFVPLLPSCCSFFFFGREMSFLVGSIVLLSMLVAILVLLQEEMSTHSPTPPSSLVIFI